MYLFFSLYTMQIMQLIDITDFYLYTKKKATKGRAMLISKLAVLFTVTLNYIQGEMEIDGKLSDNIQ